MTALAAVNWGRYALVATDECQMVHSGDEWRPELGQKIFPCGYGGWMVGTGLADLINATAAEFAEFSVKNPETIPFPLLVKYIETRCIAARAKFRKRCEHHEYPDIQKAFAFTRFFFSVVQRGSSSMPRRTQVLVYSPDTREDGLAGYCQPGEIILSVPEGTPDGIDADWQRDLRKRLRPLKDFGSELESVNYHCGILGAYILRLGELFENVSRSGIIGLHTSNGTLQVKRFPKADVSDVAASMVPLTDTESRVH